MAASFIGELISHPVDVPDIVGTTCLYKLIPKVLDMGISQEEKENILGKNAAPLLGMN
jgi:hypothetical protein